MSDQHIVEDTCPQLGGDLDLNGHSIAGATATEIGYLSGASGAIQTQLDSAEKTANKNQPNGYPGLDANGNLTGTIILRNGTGAEIDPIVLLAGEAVYCTDTREIRIGDGQTPGGQSIGVGETKADSGSFHTDTFYGHPLRAYTSSDRVTAVIAGGDYTAEFADSPLVLFSGGSQLATGLDNAIYDAQSNTTTIITDGGLGTNGSIVAFPSCSATCGTGCSATGATAFTANGGATACGNFFREMMSGNTTDATPTAITLGNGAGDLENVATMTLPFICDTDTTYAFLIHLAARQDDGTSAMFVRQAVIKNVNDTVSVEGTVQTVGVDINPANWAVAISADDANKCLQILVTGADAANIRWVAIVHGVEIGF